MNSGLILTLHIGGALFSMALVACAVYVIARRKDAPLLRPLLVLSALWQLVSGGLLMIVGGSIMRTCITGVLYLTAMALTYHRLNLLSLTLKAALRSPQSNRG